MPTDLPTERANYPHFMAIQTRWMDNDVYGHVNNVVYYSYFDTVVNSYLMAQGVLNIQESEVIGLVVETKCSYKASVAFPDQINAGLRVTRLGTSSVRYEVGIFNGDADEAAASGYFIHVYVDRKTNRPVPLLPKMRAALERILVSDAAPAQAAE